MNNFGHSLLGKGRKVHTHDQSLGPSDGGNMYMEFGHPSYRGLIDLGGSGHKCSNVLSKLGNGNNIFVLNEEGQPSSYRTVTDDGGVIITDNDDHLNFMSSHQTNHDHDNRIITDNALIMQTKSSAPSIEVNIDGTNPGVLLQSAKTARHLFVGESGSFVDKEVVLNIMVEQTMIYWIEIVIIGSSDECSFVSTLKVKYDSVDSRPMYLQSATDASTFGASVLPVNQSSHIEFVMFDPSEKRFNISYNLNITTFAR